MKLQIFCQVRTAIPREPGSTDTISLAGGAAKSKPPLLAIQRIRQKINTLNGKEEAG
jgi:hypothetical protein